MCFILFKQKTAYEMRISDWSSDVCSSDLPPTARNQFLDAEVNIRAMIATGTMPPTIPKAAEPVPIVQTIWMTTWMALATTRRDRKSVVLGKSGLGRVDLGRRRITKQKIPTLDPTDHLLHIPPAITP